MEAKTKIADQYLESARTLISTTNKVIAIGVLALVGIWYLAVEKKFNDYVYVLRNTSIQEAHIGKRIGYLQQRLSITDKRIAEKIEPALETQATVPALNDSLEFKRNTYKLQIKSLHTDLRTVRDTMDAAKKIFEINNWSSFVKFIFLVSGDPESGGLVLSLQFLALVAYTYYTRIKYLRAISKAVRIYNTDSTTSYDDLFVSAPFWIAPIPQKLNYSVKPEDMKIIMGWNGINHYMNFLLLMVLGGILLIDFRLLYTLTITNHSELNVYTYGIILSILTTVVIVTLWLAPAYSFDNFNKEKRYNPTVKTMKRRTLLIGGATILVFFVARRFVPEWATIKKYYVKRFKTKKNKPEVVTINKFHDKLLLNPKSGNVHFINGKGRSMVLKDIRKTSDVERFLQHAAVITTETLINTRRDDYIPQKAPGLRAPSLINKTTGTVLTSRGAQGSKLPVMPDTKTGSYCENLAKFFLHQGDYNAAKSILLYGIENGARNSNRIYDFLAIICCKTNDNDILRKLSVLAYNKDSSVFNYKASLWNDEKWITKVKRKRKHFDGFDLKFMG